MAKLNDFIGQVKGEGLMKQNRYIITMALPRSLQALYSGDLRKVLLFCDTVSIPGVTIGSSPALTYGEVREMPYEKLFTPANLSFYVDNSMHVKKLFDQWQGTIVNPQTRNLGYYRNYTTDIDIDILDVYDNNRYRVTMHEAYLKDISPIQMDASNRDVMKLNVAIQYKYWTASDAYASVSHPDNRGFFEKIFDAFFGDGFELPTGYFNDFPSFQGDFNRTVPKLGGHSLPGAAYSS